MPITYEPIATQTLGSTAATVTFSSIPSTYTDLVLVTNYIATSLGNTVNMTFNSDTASNYSRTYIGAWAAPTASSGTTRFTSRNNISCFWQVGAASTTTPNPMIYNIMNYSNTTTYKTVLSRFNTMAATLSEVSAEIGLWRTNSAINRIDLTSSATTFAIGSTFTLYGIKAA
jgi:hypothetical protein